MSISNYVADLEHSKFIESSSVAGKPGVIVLNPDGSNIGGGGGGGAATIADGADVAEGATTDAASAAGGTGSVSAKLRRISTDASTLATNLPAKGQATMANSTPVAIASDQAVFPIKGGLTHNNTAPAAVNLGVLPALANAAAPTFTEGDQVLQSLDLSGNQRTSLGTLLAGEDLTVNVIKVEQRFSYATITTATTTTIKSGAGFIHTISILGGTLGAITVYDNTAGSGTTICPTFTPTSTVPCPAIILDDSFAIGLTIVTAAATIISVSYR